MGEPPTGEWENGHAHFDILGCVNNSGKSAEEPVPRAFGTGRLAACHFPLVPVAGEVAQADGPAAAVK